MKYEIVKIVIIFLIITFVNYIRPHPTHFGHKLLAENKISYKDLNKLKYNYLDFRSTGDDNE